MHTLVFSAVLSYLMPHLYPVCVSPCSLLKPGDLTHDSVHLWSFKQIAKEKFSVPLRDNYETVKLPHSSRWVITFSPIFPFFYPLKWNHQFLKPWQSTIPLCRRPSDFWMKAVRSKPIMSPLKGFPPLTLFVSPSTTTPLHPAPSLFSRLVSHSHKQQPICILGNYVQFVNRRWTLVELDFANRPNDI